MKTKKMGTRLNWVRILLWASAMAFSPQVNAQSTEKEAEPPIDAPSPEDPALLTVSPQEQNASEAESRVSILEAQIAGLQGQLDDIKKQIPKASPTWKGAPQWADADDGWSFKVRGRFMADAGYISEPANYAANRNLGFNARVRRVRIGVEGGLPGGFGYKAEVDYANAAVGFGDVVLTFNQTAKPFTATLGNFESLDGMEQMTSSRWSSFIERAQVNDAFGNTRRIGAAIGFKSSDSLFRFDTGMFVAHSIDASIDNDGWIGAARATYTPWVGKGFVHLGASFQHRQFQSNDNGVASSSVGAPSTNQIGRYRARPFLQTTDVRFVDTGSFAAKGDDIFGVELYGVFQSLHLGGEAQWTKVRAYAPGTVATGRDAFAGGSVVTPLGNPTFFGGHFEIGYFLTGETRGYKNGLWDRTKVLHPVSKGGWGAFQLLARVDYLDLDSDALKNGPTNSFATGATTLAATNARLGRGGKQLGYLAGVTWIPTDYVRFMINYIHTNVTGGPLAATVQPASLLPVDQRQFSTDAVAVRAQFDF
jgi:phosphate-selective porin OprO and OprP